MSESGPGNVQDPGPRPRRAAGGRRLKKGLNGKKCAAKRPNGKICKNPAGFRTTHRGYGRCFVHGGSSPSGIRASQREAAIDAVVTYGLPREIDPHTALLEEVWRTAGHVQFIGDILRELERDALVWGKVEETESTGGEEGDRTSTKKAALPNVWLKLYQEERRHLVTVCQTAIACGIAEKQVRIAEDQARLIAQILLGALGDLGLDTKSEPVRLVVRRRLELAAANAVEPGRPPS